MPGTIFQSPRFWAATITPGQEYTQQLPAFEAHSIVVDNLSTIWYYSPEADRFVPPHTIGWCATLSSQQVSLMPQSPLGAEPTTGVPGTITAIWYEDNLAPSPGLNVPETTVPTQLIVDMPVLANTWTKVLTFGQGLYDLQYVRIAVPSAAKVQAAIDLDSAGAPGTDVGFASETTNGPNDTIIVPFSPSLVVNNGVTSATVRALYVWSSVAQTLSIALLTTI